MGGIGKHFLSWKNNVIKLGFREKFGQIVRTK